MIIYRRICNVTYVKENRGPIDTGVPNTNSSFFGNSFDVLGFNLWCFWEIGVYACPYFP